MRPAQSLLGHLRFSHMALYVTILGEGYPDLGPEERTPGGHPDFLELKRADTASTGSRWTMPATAQPGDRCLFYYKSPVSAFVASAIIIDRPRLETRGYWRDHHMAAIGSVRLLPRPVPLGEVRAAFPDWGWPRAPRRSVRVPEHLTAKLNAYLGNKLGRLRAAEVSAIEGLKKETVRLTRTRSRALRQLVLDAAGGRCDCCGQDFSKFPWAGVRAPLQVHHRRQLGLDDVPRTTRARDLVTVCANCHTMIHSDPRSALPVAVLRRYLIGALARHRRRRHH